MSQELLSNLQALINQLCSNGAESSPSWSNTVDAAASLSERLSHSFGLDWNQLDHLSIQLWNKTVVLKTKGTLDNVSITKLRQISFQMISATNDASNDEVSLKTQLKMGLRVARSWLDIKELASAEKVLALLTQTVQRLQRIVIGKRNQGPNTSLACKDKREVESHMLHIFCLRAELTSPNALRQATREKEKEAEALQANIDQKKFAKEERDEAYSIFQNAQDMLPNLPDQAPYLSNICYGFGVDCFHSCGYDQAIMWLRNSYSLGREGSHTVGGQTQARTLRLLANCYMELKDDGWQEKALNAVSLANTEYPHPSGLHISMHIHLQTHGKEEDIDKDLKTILDHRACNLDIFLNTIQLLKSFQRRQPAFDLRHSIIQKFQLSTKLGLLLTAMLDLLLSEDANSLSMAKTFAEECVSAHVSGQRLDQMTKKQFHIIFWNKAAHFFQMNSYEEALSWYTFSLSLYSTSAQGESNLAKLHRNIATCHLNMGHFEGAFENIEKSQECDPSCPQTHLVAYKIALNTSNIERASSSLQKLIDCVSRDQVGKDAKVVCMAAYLAMERGMSELAIPALECVSNNMRCEDRAYTALKCLLRLKVSQVEDKRADAKSMLGNLQTAYSKLLVIQDSGSLSTSHLQDEASWFMKIAWNLALKAENDLTAMKDFFILCSQLLSLCITDISNHNKYQTCLVMANAACLQLARLEVNKELQINLLEESLQHIEEYKRADSQAQNSLWAQGPLKTSASTDILMMMYEFEALTKLNHPRAEAVLERALTLPKPDPNIFHTLAALASDPPSNNIALSMRALKVAIRIHLQAEDPDFEKCSVDVRSLIEMCMENSEKEALCYFKEALDMIGKRANGLYPDIELLWLMTKSWNHGLQYFNCNKFTSAEQWCSLSMQLLKHIPTAQEDYEEQMMSLYGELMSRLERDGKRTAAEDNEWLAGSAEILRKVLCNRLASYPNGNKQL